MICCLPRQREGPPVGEDDVGIHGCHVQMVDEGSFLPVWMIPQRLQMCLDVVSDLLVISGIIKLPLALYLNCISQVLVKAVN